MKLIQMLLTEGLIKLPVTLMKNAWAFVLGDTLKRCHASLEYDETVTEREISAAESLLDYACRGFDFAFDEYGANLPHTASSSKAFPIEVPKRYLERYTALRGNRETKGLLKKKITVTVVNKTAGFTGMTAKTSGTYYAEGSVVAVQPAAYDLTTEGILEIIRKFKTPSAQHHALGLLLNQYKGTLEHEMTHMLQFLVFGDIHHKQLLGATADDSVQAGSEEEKDIYFSSPIEFDPWIKADLAKIRAVLKRKPHTADEKRELIKKFVSADLTVAKAITFEGNKDAERSDFFLSLRRQNMKKWKQAAKLLTSHLDEKELA